MGSITYNIRHITSDKDKDLVALLDLYETNIEPSIRTNTNEITQWLNNYNKDNRYCNSFWILALYINDKPIGFCQSVYFKSSKILFIDYCVIEERFRGRVFNEFLYLMKDFYKEQNLEIYYYVTEIPFFSNANTPSIKSIALTRLLKMSGFKVIKAPYYQPELGLTNHESEMKASLMIFTNGGEQDKQSLRTDTYLDILETIYFKHYYYWYVPFMCEYEQKRYHTKLSELSTKIKSELKNQETIILNGEAYSFGQANGDIPLKKSSNKKIIFLMIVIPIVTFFLLCVLSWFLKQKLEFEHELQNNILTTTAIISLAAIVVWAVSNQDIRSLFADFAKSKIKN
jgi:hypothetical protein